MSVVKKILSIVNEIKKPAFKIESAHQDRESGLMYFLVRIEGKGVLPVKKDPLVLIREGNPKKSFSKEDYDWIIDMLLENQKRLIENKYKKKYSLIKHQFSEQLKEPLVVFNDSNNKIYIKPVKEIYSDLNYIRKFSPEDSACIGNIVGSYVAEQEYKLRNKYKNNVVKFDTSLLSG